MVDIESVKVYTVGQNLETFGPSDYRAPLPSRLSPPRSEISVGAPQAIDRPTVRIGGARTQSPLDQRAMVHRATQAAIGYRPLP